MNVKIEDDFTLANLELLAYLTGRDVIITDGGKKITLVKKK